MKAEEGGGGIQRAFTPKTTWERFTSRLKHGWQGAKFDTDQGASQAAWSSRLSVVSIGAL